MYINFVIHTHAYNILKGQLENGIHGTQNGTENILLL